MNFPIKADFNIKIGSALTILVQYPCPQRGLRYEVEIVVHDDSLECRPTLRTRIGIGSHSTEIVERIIIQYYHIIGAPYYKQPLIRYLALVLL